MTGIEGNCLFERMDSSCVVQEPRKREGWAVNERRVSGIACYELVEGGQCLAIPFSFQSLLTTLLELLGRLAHGGRECRSDDHHAHATKKTHAPRHKAFTVTAALRVRGP